MIKFNEKYNSEEFLDFLRDFLPDDFVEKEEDIIINKDRYKIINKAKILGFCESLDLYVLEMDHAKEKDPRVAITTDAFKILADHWIHRAVVIFKNNDSENYRFSYLTISLDLNDKNKAVKKYSNARRYSFYLGKDAKIKTAESFLIKKEKVKSVEDLLDRFNVEIVTKEFYQNYKKLFEKLLDYLKNDKVFNAFAGKHGLKLEIFSKKLLGQIVFIYFLQKKGWLGAKRGEYISKGDPQFLRNIFEKCQTENKNYFNDYLEYLFYNCLNKIPERAGSFYREKFDCQIPFLNGGLFEPINDYKWQDEFIHIPNEIFSNEKGDGILDIFDLYNFTIDENTADDQEVSVDPEMLGKVFENLLEDNIRKGQGAFYTPREIVHYMCQESLINFLDSNFNLDRKTAEEYVKFFDSKDEPKATAGWEGEIVKIDEALQNIKICDPACGSGAFLVGMLNEIVRLRYFLRMLNPNLPKKTLYELKKDTIQSSLYGVDIDPGAVDIAKLRFWLSIVVDEEVDEVEPLPNLDYKIMQGNSLLEDLVIGDSVIKFDFRGGKKMDRRTKEQKALFELGGIQGKLILDQSDDLVDKLEKLHAEFFSISDPDKKKILKKKIDNIEDELIQSKCNEEIENAEFVIQNNTNDSKKILKNTEKVLAVKGVLNKWKKDHIRPFFPWKLHFGEVFNRENGGFDIAIGNPPYIDSETMVRSGQKNMREILTKIYQSAKGNWDLFIVFLERGILLNRENGILSYIIPNKLISQDYADNIREMMVSNAIIEIRDYSRIPIFLNADVYPITFVLKKNKNTNADIKMTKMSDVVQIKYSNIIDKNIINKDGWDVYFSNPEIVSMIKKVDKNKGTLDSFGSFESPCTVAEAYEIKKFIEDEEYAEGYKKFINSGTIDKYISLWGIKKTKYIKDSYNKPVISTIKIYSVNSRRENQFNNPKIIIANMTGEIEAFLDLEGEYLAGKSTAIFLGEKDNLKMVVALLNSNLISFLYKIKYHSGKMSGGALSISPTNIASLHVPEIKEEIKNVFIGSVDKILEITESENYLEDFEKQARVKEYEKQIDQMVYRLYNLTPEEIEIVENSK
ncbi:MAG: DNA methyltransferase [Candidatus Moraniibacteriota bacterium]